MPEDNGNPFNDETLTNHPSVEAQPADGNPFADESLTAEEGASTGQVTNDVGNTVITPKDGESFADTMKRAAAQGKVTTPEQVNRETASAPGKVAQTLAAAPLIGFAGAGALAAPGAIYDAAVSHLDQLTKVVRAARSLGWTSFGLKEAHDIFKMVAPDDKK